MTHSLGPQGRREARRLGRALARRGLSVSVAESCTGGLLSEWMTDAPGASKYFRGGMVPYTNEAKQRWLGVEVKVLKKAGAVSAPTAAALAQGIREKAGSDAGVAVTGIAGPTGGTRLKPVGLVYIAVATSARTRVNQFFFSGSRTDVREKTGLNAIVMLRSVLLG